ncbi:MAG TPA: isoleucine--tRNA ligase [Acidimicrobiales bacterium]|nr:isoleucine--tRNA ligase [Acidimicrobiales bacterium]
MSSLTSAGDAKDDRHRPYPAVSAQPSYPALEEETLAFWEKDGTFEASVARRAKDPEFVFYDGPPFANGLPHYGHLLTGFVKDAVPRYQTMRGRRVERVFGWDCHGLPAEMAAEGELGLAGRLSVIDFGVDRFNGYCRQLVQRTTDAWERYVTRQARWVDFEHAYKTMDLAYMESVIWAFKQLHERGLTYEGYRVLPYCWECETPLSNFETRQDDAYRDRTDPAVTVRFELEPAGDEPGESNPLLSGPLSIVVWTTTPWTLPSNLAIAVGAELDYAVVETTLRGERARLVLGADRLEAYAGDLGEYSLLGVVKGAALVGRRYRPLFDYFAGTDNAFSIVAGDFVTTEDGTGVVHMAPGFGEDDQNACEAAGIPVLVPVDDRGRFTSEIADFAGLQVFEANPLIVAALAEKGALVRSEEFTHSYPHCWRSDTPLIYRAVSSWFVKVTAIRDRMVELNQQIAWTPEHVRDGAFGKWLENARDWSISRNRFWGAPLPIWKSDDPAYPRIDVYGSLDEIEADFGVRPTELHRPAVDALTRPNPDDPTGRSTMRRIEDVFDCWFESGSMPYAQWHYPFENKERFEEHFPADFIVEYISQTRGWFYTLHVLSTALFDRPPFKSCIVHGVILGRDGRKLSKRLRNFPDPEQVFAEQGADSMRWYLLSSAVLRGLDVVIDEAALREPVRLVLNPIWNTWYFLSLYSNADGLRGRWRTDQAGELDRYVLAKSRQLVEQVTGAMEANELAAATSAIAAFLDVLTNWYVRRSRDRFWRPGAGPAAAEDADKLDAYDTLHTVLEVLCRVSAPFLPYLSEVVYRDLTGERSVHLADWPRPEELPDEPELVAAMDLVRDVASAGHSIRKQAGRRARLPLRSLTVAAPGAERLQRFVGLLADELNVKRVELVGAIGPEHAEQVLAVVPAALGPRLGAETQRVIGAVREGSWTRTADGQVEAAGVRLEPGEYTLRLRPADERASRVLPGDAGVVSLDLETDEELEAEGLARDVVRIIQQARREAGFQVTDRIEAALEAAPAVCSAVGAWGDFVAEQVLADRLELSPVEGDGGPVDGERLPNGQRVKVRLERR